MPISHGYRRKTRALLSRSPRERGKNPLSRLLYEYRPGDKIVVDINPSVHKGMPHRRYHGRVGVVIGKRGKAYEIEVTQGETVKTIIVRPEHIKPLT
ncbi:MAG: 50S ribosomal protein L21e [Candidatus Bathyarchaeia archaeon]